MKSKNNKILLIIGICLFIVILVFLFFNKKTTDNTSDNTPFTDENGRLIVIAASFPVYDLAKNVGGDKAAVFLILPPGMEPHSYQPTAKEIELIKTSAIFFYTSSLMETWAPDLAKIITPKTKIISVAEKLNDNSSDPHVWLDFSKTQLMVDNIAATYESLDPVNAAYYQQNATNYKQKLSKLDDEYFSGLKDCNFKEFISSGHFTFGYLARRYNLGYQSVQGVIPDNSLDTDRIIRLSQEIKEKKQPYIYYEELIMPRVGGLMRQTSGAELLSLNAAHNVGPYDIESGITFLSLMENNLLVLKKGLICH